MLRRVEGHKQGWCRVTASKSPDSAYKSLTARFGRLTARLSYLTAHFDRVTARLSRLTGRFGRLPARLSPLPARFGRVGAPIGQVAGGFAPRKLKGRGSVPSAQKMEKSPLLC